VLDDARLEALNARGDRLREQLNAVMAPHGWVATGMGSMVGFHPVPGPVSSPADIAGADDRRRELLFLDLLERGFYVAPRGFIALSIEVTDDDVDEFVAAVAEALAARS
jgi:glutamate-1-semialdehyde 2,1-aminomutase